MTSNTFEVEQFKAIVLTPGDSGHDALLKELQDDIRIEVVDRRAQQLEELRQLRPEPPSDLIDEPTHWIYYPWRRTVAGLLGPRAFHRMRLDRNRNLITADEQDRLRQVRIGVIGLSVGHAIAYSLAAQGVCGELRLSDFDHLELPNLNRVPATVLDQGVNKAVVAARRIAELDPYLPVSAVTSGITPESVGEFMDGLDIVIEECDSLDAKVLVREAARARRIPVIMTTSDRGLLDVERFDLDPTRPILHGLLGDIDAAGLSGLSSKDKIPFALRILDPGRISAKMAASLVEVGTTLTTWPQLAVEVGLGATIVAEAVRRIGLGEKLPSGRLRVDALAMLDDLADPLDDPQQRPSAPEPPIESGSVEPSEPSDPSEAVAAAANRAPSGGNTQPWYIDTRPDRVTIRIAPQLTSTMDVAYRASAVAVGAAVFNARIAAAAQGLDADVHFSDGDESSPLHATVRLRPGGEGDLARLYEPMMRRETNRRYGSPTPIDDDAAAAMIAAAHHQGMRLRIISARPEMEQAAAILGEADRIRYLTPHLHAEMFSELRWPGDPSPETGIDVLSLDVDHTDLIKLDILRRPDVIAHLAGWNAGSALGDDTRERITASAALGVVSMDGRSLIDYARAGTAVEAVWIAAEGHGLGVQPVSPAFLYAHDERDLRELSPSFADDLGSLQYNFRTLVGTTRDESMALVLRFSLVPRSSVRSRRRVLRRASIRER
ncbi:MAG: Rv1355c family protein [Actinobacteria bacterium]|nr:Rv1355c family protein [Actinomycetota bacterium]